MTYTSEININKHDSKDNQNNEDNQNNDTIDNIADYFEFPIFYNNSKKELQSHIIHDLELIHSAEPSGNPIYHHYFNVTNSISSQTANKASKYYTTDVEFLKETQNLLANYKKADNKYTDYSQDYQIMIDTWNKVKKETSFKEKYYYVDWPMFEFLNNSSQFLQIMSIYNLASPIISLLIPVIILIIPFFVIKLKGIKLTVEEYVQILKILINQNAIGRLFTQFNQVSTQEKLYLLLSAIFYLFSFYQNVMVCVRFNQNMKQIHSYLFELRTYLDYTIRNIDNFLKYSQSLKTYQGFNDVLIQKRDTLTAFKMKINRISAYQLSIKKISEIGDILKCFYEFYNDENYHNALMYSFGFNGYIDCIQGLQTNIEERKIGVSSFTLKKRRAKFSKSYYGVLKEVDHVKNTVRLDKNLIITGPNASGKTTILKSTLINVIFTQQFGCGFYENAELCPFDFVHCYLNIPDTSGRDSLFQAEARRCKEIIDIVHNNTGANHFSVFDELYSGTNPDEAVTSATAFMKYLIKHKNVTCLLTTHFVKVCKKLDKNKNVKNCHMETNKKNNKITYTYNLKDGISEIKGGINVLCDMDYPKEIIDATLRDCH